MNIIMQDEHTGSSTADSRATTAVSVQVEEGGGRSLSGGARMAACTRAEAPGSSVTHQHHPHAIITNPVQVCSIQLLV